MMRIRCCVAQGPVEDHRVATLRAELGGLKLSELRHRALALSVSQDRLDAADDAPDIKAAVIELVLEASLAQQPAGDGGAEVGLRPGELGEVRAELEGLKLSLVRARARAAGIAAARLEEADDEESPKQAIIELLLAHHAGSGAVSGRRRPAERMESQLPCP